MALERSQIRWIKDMGPIEPEEHLSEGARKIAEAVRATLQQGLEEAFVGLYTSTNCEDAPAPDIKAMLADIERWVRNERRQQVVFVVDEAHEGPMLRHDTPCDGVRIELSYAQASQVHDHWLLKLSRVIDEHTAEFVPASYVFPEPVQSVLPAPPYYVPADDGAGGDDEQR